jgi:hypothetical protein
LIVKRPEAKTTSVAATGVFSNNAESALITGSLKVIAILNKIIHRPKSVWLKNNHAPCIVLGKYRQKIN